MTAAADEEVAAPLAAPSSHVRPIASAGERALTRVRRLNPCIARHPQNAPQFTTLVASLEYGLSPDGVIAVAAKYYRAGAS